MSQPREEVITDSSRFVTKDSGQREEFATGARRDTQDGKPRYDLISPIMMRRVAELMERGARKNGERNWEAGMPMSRYLASAMRHLYAYMEGDNEEDHLAAVVFNIQGMMHVEQHVLMGKLSDELVDIGAHKGSWAKDGKNV